MSHCRYLYSTSSSSASPIAVLHPRGCPTPAHQQLSVLGLPLHHQTGLLRQIGCLPRPVFFLLSGRCVWHVAPWWDLAFRHFLFLGGCMNVCPGRTYFCGRSGAPWRSHSLCFVPLISWVNKWAVWITLSTCRNAFHHLDGWCLAAGNSLRGEGTILFKSWAARSSGIVRVPDIPRTAPTARGHVEGHTPT